jgi:hypothetical protein
MTITSIAVIAVSLYVVATTLALRSDTYANGPGENSALLTQVQTIPLNSVEGRIDHFGLDAKGNRLFVSALGNNTVEVVDLVAGKVTNHISNLRAPQGIGFAPETNRLGRSQRRGRLVPIVCRHIVAADRDRRSEE